MSQPFIYETARVPVTQSNPDGQPLGQTVRVESRESMNPDTFDWAYLDMPATTGRGAANRVKVVCNNAIEPGDTTTTYTWSAQGGNSANVSFFANPTGGAALTGGALAAADFTTIYAQFATAAGNYTIRCALSSSAAAPANRNVDRVIAVT